MALTEQPARLESPQRQAGSRAGRGRSPRARRMRLAAWTLGLLAGLGMFGPGPARADTVRLTDGTTLRGRAVKIGDRLEVFGFSGVETVPLSRVAAVETAPLVSAQPPAPSATLRPAATPPPRPVLDPRGLFQRAWALDRLGQPDDAAAMRRLALSEELSGRARALSADDEAGWAHLELLAVLGGLDPGLVPALRRRARAVRELAKAGAAPAVRRTWPGPSSVRGPRGRVVVIYPRSSRLEARGPTQRRRAQVIVFGGGDRLRSRSRSRSRRPGGITAGAAYRQGGQTFGATRGGRTTFEAMRAQRSVTFGAARAQGKVTFRRARAQGGATFRQARAVGGRRGR